MANPSLLIAMGGWMLNRLANVLADEQSVWAYHEITQSVTLAAAGCFIVGAIPYRHLALKCLAGAFFLSCLLDAVYVWVAYVLEANFYEYSCVAQALVVLVSFIFYTLRSYKEPNDALDEDHVFCLRQRPHDVQGLIISMLGMFGPYAGYALYANGILYAYHEGTLTARNIDEKLLKSYHVTRGRKVTPAFHQEMKKWVGGKWTLKQNCLTLLRRIWGQYK